MAGGVSSSGTLIIRLLAHLPPAPVSPSAVGGFPVRGVVLIVLVALVVLFL